MFLMRQYQRRQEERELRAALDSIDKRALKKD
jgi:hypothetical protein